MVNRRKLDLSPERRKLSKKLTAAFTFCLRALISKTKEETHGETHYDVLFSVVLSADFRVGRKTERGARDHVARRRFVARRESDSGERNAALRNASQFYSRLATQNVIVRKYIYTHIHIKVASRASAIAIRARRIGGFIVIASRCNDR